MMLWFLLGWGFLMLIRNWFIIPNTPKRKPVAAKAKGPKAQVRAGPSLAQGSMGEHGPSYTQERGQA